MTSPTTKPDRTLSVVAWVALVLVWVCTPFVGDDLPGVVTALYWVFLGAAVIFGLVMAVRGKRWLLGVFSVLTLFAWPILLFFAPRMGGI